MNQIATRAFLKGYGYTPDTLAIDMKISRPRAIEILDGEREFTRWEIEAISWLFGLSFDAMLEYKAPGKVRAFYEQIIRRQERAKAGQASKEYDNPGPGTAFDSVVATLPAKEDI